MKELSIEQKARAYDKALNKARQLLDYPTTNFRRDLDDLFPELKESEDERIRKAISQCVEDMRGQFEKLYSVHHKDAIAWLEKQAPRITPEEKPLKESKNERIRKTLFDFFVSIDVSHILAWLDNQKSVVWLMLQNAQMTLAPVPSRIFAVLSAADPSIKSTNLNGFPPIAVSKGTVASKTILSNVFSNLLEINDKSLLVTTILPKPNPSIFSTIENVLGLDKSLEIIKPLPFITNEDWMVLPPGAAHISKTKSSSSAFNKKAGTIAEGS